MIVTSDKDLAQLVSDRVTLFDAARNQRFDAAGVEAKFGVRPDQITDFLGLAGDAVDNIPGVRGIGPKTAADLLRKYGSIEGVYENIAAVLPRGVAAKLERDVELAGLSKRLATVATSAPIATSLDALRYRGPEEARLRDVFARLGFGTLTERVLRVR